MEYKPFGKYEKAVSSLSNMRFNEIINMWGKVG